MSFLIIDTPCRHTDGDIYLGHLKVPPEAIPAFLIVPMNMLIGCAIGNEVRLRQKPVGCSLPKVHTPHRGTLVSSNLVKLSDGHRSAKVRMHSAVGSTGWVWSDLFISDAEIEAYFK